MPIREYQCDYCGYVFDSLMYSSTPEDYRYTQCRCGSQAEVLPGKPATARGNFGTTPRNPKSDKPAKFNFNVDEPEQKEFDFTKES